MRYRSQTAIALAAFALAVAPATAQPQTNTQGGQSGQQAQAGDTSMAGASQLCNTGFQSADSNDDGTISRDEFDAGQARNFDALDTNSDSELSRSEYVDCLNQEEQASGDQDNPWDSVAEADRDQSGDISRDEYMRATNDAQRQAQSSRGDENAVMILRRYIFVPVSMEADQVGQMGSEETAARASQQFNRVDQDGNGRLSEQEWSSRNQNGNDLKGALDRQFDSLDADSSGSVSRDEFTQAGERRWQAGEKAGQQSGMSGSMDGGMSDRQAGQQSSTNPSDQQSGNRQNDSAMASDGSGSGSDSRDGGDVPVVYYHYFVPLGSG